MNNGHHRRWVAHNHGQDLIPQATCLSCNRRVYPSRKIARRAAKNRYPSEVFRIYEYPGEDGWHIGRPSSFFRKQLGGRFLRRGDSA